MSNIVYRCDVDSRHVVTSPRPMQVCPAIVHGSPCRGQLIRIDRHRRKEQA